MMLNGKIQDRNEMSCTGPGQFEAIFAVEGPFLTDLALRSDRLNFRNNTSYMEITEVV